MIALILMDPVPMTCYVMQGDHPIPQAVIQKFAESGSELCPNLFLLSVLLRFLRLLRDSQELYRQVRLPHNLARAPDRMSRGSI